MRPLPSKKAKVAKPMGHQMMNEATRSAIHAGLPISSSLAARCMRNSYVNVSYINIGGAPPAGCQGEKRKILPKLNGLEAGSRAGAPGRPAEAEIALDYAGISAQLRTWCRD